MILQQTWTTFLAVFWTNHSSICANIPTKGHALQSSLYGWLVHLYSVPSSWALWLLQSDYWALCGFFHKSPSACRVLRDSLFTAAVADFLITEQNVLSGASNPHGDWWRFSFLIYAFVYLELFLNSLSSSFSQLSYKFTPRVMIA